MPRLMKHMFKRRNSFYTRLRRGGQDKWIPLGSEYEDACRRLRKLNAGGLVAVSRLTVNQAVAKWIESYVRTRRAASDLQMAKQRHRDYLAPFMGHMLLAAVTKEDVRAYRLWIERDGRLKPASVKHILSDLRCLMNWAVDSDLLDKSAFPRRVMPKL